MNGGIFKRFTDLLDFNGFTFLVIFGSFNIVLGGENLSRIGKDFTFRSLFFFLFQGFNLFIQGGYFIGNPFQLQFRFAQLHLSLIGII